MIETNCERCGMQCVLTDAEFLEGCLCYDCESEFRAEDADIEVNEEE